MYKFKKYGVIVHEGTKKGLKNYKEATRKTSNQEIKIRLYCGHEGCYNYLKGTEYYNGAFISETGVSLDLRNQVFHCREHIKEQDGENEKI